MSSNRSSSSTSSIHEGRLNDENYKGPPTKRKLTDSIFLPLFFILSIIWYFIGSYAMKNGDIEKLLAPGDSDGQKCGIDNAVSDKPYLFYFNLTECVTVFTFLSGCSTKQICMENCPTETWFVTDLLSNGSSITDWKSQVVDKLICISPNIKNKVDSIEKLKDVIITNQCASYYFKSYPGITNRCIPYLDEINERINKTGGASIINENENYQLIQNYLTVLTNFWNNLKNDIKRCWPVVTLFFVICTIVCLFYIMILSYFARFIIWTTIIIVMVLLAFCAVVSYGNYMEIQQDVQFKWTFNSIFKQKSTWLALTIVSVVALLVFFLLSVFLHSRIQLALLIISESSKAVDSMKITLVFPILPFLLKLLILYWFVLVLLNLRSFGDAEYRVYGLLNDTDCQCKNTDYYYIDNAICVPRKFESECRRSLSNTTCEIATCKYNHRILPETILYYHLFNLFALLWGIYLISGWNTFVLAYCYGKWYWTLGKKPFFALFPSIYLSIRYHLGTVTIGSFVLACVAFIRSVLLYIQSTLKRYDDNLLCQCVFWTFNCLFWCLHKFLIFLTDNAYIMSAIYGGGFFSSAGQAFNLILRNVIRIIVMDKIVGFLLFVGKVFIVLGVTTLSYFTFINITPSLENAYTLIALIGVGSFIIVYQLFSAYRIAVDTLLLCFLLDGELNNGSLERPYYMSKKLGLLLRAVKDKRKNN